MKTAIDSLIAYSIEHQLIAEADSVYCRNCLLDILGVHEPVEIHVDDSASLCEILTALCDYAVEHKLINDNITERDLYDTKIMGIFTPFPHEVSNSFFKLYSESSKAATDWYYEFSKTTNYIRSDRIKKDIHWLYECKYGELEISINLSKPEKDPRAIAAAKRTVSSSFPKCQLCIENEGYSGRLDHPARQNLRLIPIKLNKENYYLQYSPYVYYNEHCIVLNKEHIPMRINEETFRKLIDFVTLFPHYFLGSNADLPIVGGSILSHDHFQGGNHEFPMAKASLKEKLSFEGFEDVTAGIVNWPMSVIRICSAKSDKLIALAVKIFDAWKNYTDEESFILAETDGEPHNTITPIARRRGNNFEMDLVLRNNITTAERPLGVYHPRPELHHIKKENIGLIEVMGLAILPGRLKKELDDIRSALINSSDISGDETLTKHAEWVSYLRNEYSFNADNADDILRKETGKVFEQVLEDAGVFKTDTAGMQAFLKFISYAGGSSVT